MKKSEYEALKRINKYEITERQCTTCQDWKEETTDNFYMMNKLKPQKGFMAECKDCIKKKANEYGHSHKEKKNKIDREYREANKAERKVKEKVWRDNNKENLYNNLKKFQKNNPDRLKYYNNQHSNHDITTKEWESCKKYFNHRCAYCGLPIEEHYITRKGITKLGDFHKEHVVHKGSNGLDNCVPSCGSCNSSKWEHPFENWYNKENINYTEERYQKIIQWLNGDYEQYVVDKKKKVTNQ
jgi:hypothetical protein